jgi:hypothetical protein
MEVSFEEFSENVRWILRFQDKESVEKFLSISDLVLGFREWSKTQVEGMVEDYYIEALSGGVPKKLAARSAEEYQLKFYINFPPTYFKKSTDLGIREQKKALKYLYVLQEMQTVRNVDGLCLDLNTVQNSIDFIEDSIKSNEVLNTGGKPTSINDQELLTLVRLKHLYTISFPKNSTRYTPGNLLHQLGECLVEKSIPRKIDTLIDKAIIHLRSHEE